MRSGTSCFNATVWKKTFLRFWPIWAANFVVWLIVFPLNGLLRLREGSLHDFANELMDYGNGMVLAVGAACISLLAAMAACGHLYTSRSANFFGAVPIRREGVFLSTYLAGLAMLILPNVVIFALMLPLELAGQALCLPVLLFWLASVCAMELFFFSFAVFCGMFAGHILALPVYYGVFNVFALAAYWLLHWTLGEFYYGFDRASLEGLESVVQWLTPVWKLGEVHFVYGSIDSAGAAYQDLHASGVPQLVAYAVAGLLLAEGAMLLYKYRRMESAGDIVAVKPMRPVFKYGVAVCAGLFFGFMTAAVLSLEKLGLAVCIILWGAAGCFAAQMLLDKKFNIFKKAWKGAAVLSAVFVVIFLVIGFDLTGYETRVPDPDRVEYATVTGLSCWPANDSGSHWNGVRVYDPEDLELVTALHRAAVADREQVWSKDTAWEFRVVYHLEDGTTLARRYVVYGDSGQLDVPGSTTWIVQRLLDDKELIRRAYGLDEARALLDKGGELNSAVLMLNGWSGDVPVEWLDSGAFEYGGDFARAFYGPDALDLWDAVLADFRDGNLGRHSAVRGEGFSPPHVSFDIEIRAGARMDVTRVDFALPETAARTWSVLNGKLAAAEDAG